MLLIAKKLALKSSCVLDTFLRRLSKLVILSDILILVANEAKALIPIAAALARFLNESASFVSSVVPSTFTFTSFTVVACFEMLANLALASTSPVVVTWIVLVVLPPLITLSSFLVSISVLLLNDLRSSSAFNFNLLIANSALLESAPISNSIPIMYSKNKP